MVKQDVAIQERQEESDLLQIDKLLQIAQIVKLKGNLAFKFCFDLTIVGTSLPSQTYTLASIPNSLQGSSRFYLLHFYYFREHVPCLFLRSCHFRARLPSPVFRARFGRNSRGSTD